MIIINGVPFFKNNILKWEIVKDFPETGDTILLIDTKIKTYNRMEEQLISFETAKLAHSKNFNWIDKRNTSYCSIYNIAGEIKNAGIKQLTSWINYWQKDPTDTRNNSLALVPTQTLLQKWLREVHNISLFIDCIGVGKNVYYYGIYYINNGEEDYVEQEGQFNYEEALEKGLQEALKLI